MLFYSIRNSSIYTISCDSYDKGGSRLYGGRVTSTSITYGYNSIENCHFTNVFSKDFYGMATGINGAGNTYRNNLIHNTNGQPVTHAGVDHKIELNEVFNVGVEEGDGGAFYTGGNLWSYGNIIRHNFVHHIMSVPKLLGRASFFSDDHDGGETVMENIVYKGGFEALKMNKGAGHTIIRNVVLDCYRGIRQSASTTDYSRCMNYFESNPTSKDKANYIGRMLQNIGTPGWQNGINSNNWNNRVELFWRNRYEYFDTVLNKYFSNKAMDAYECMFYENIFWGNDVDIYDKSNTADIRDSVAINLSIFDNPDVLNFKFKEPRPAFVPDIPFQNIGLYNDEYRKVIPDKDFYRKAIKDHFAHLACHTPDQYNYQTINERIYYNTGKIVMGLYK